MSSQQHDRDLNRKLLTISSCNQALLRANDEAALLNEICSIICSHTQYRMAWVGYVEHDETYSVTPQAWAGAEDGFLSQSALTWADSEEAHRPLWKAIRSGKTSYVQDLSKNAESAHWVKYAHDRGYRSTIALPLQNEKEITFAVLCIYSTQTQAFTSDEIQLLEELAANLAYGINSLRIRAERKLAEEALIASEQLFRTMIENSPDFISRYDNQLRRVYINPALQKMFDQPVNELLGTTPAVASPLHDHQRYMAAIKSVIETASECAEELSFKTPEGGTRWASMRFAPELGPDGKVNSVLVISNNITQRKLAEEERLAYLRFLESLNRINHIFQEEGELESTMNKAMDAVLDIFACDQVYLLYPCDPDTATWSVRLERSMPEYSGTLQLGVEIKTDDSVASSMRALLDSEHPLSMGMSTSFAGTDPVPKPLSTRSGLAMSLHPKVDNSWQFGIQQYSDERNWSDLEVSLFEEIGNRISDGLTSLLIMRNLRESEERFRLVFENSPVSIWEEDFSALKTRLYELKITHGNNLVTFLIEHPKLLRGCVQLVRVNDVNQAVLELHAANTKEDLFRGLSQIFIPETYESFLHASIALLQGETELQFDTAVKTLDGQRLEVTVYFSVSPGYEKCLSKVLVSLIDITERKRSVEGLRLAASVFSNSQEGILISDADNLIIDVNPAFTSLTGYQHDEVIGRNPRFLNAGRSSPDVYTEMWRALETDGKWQGELWNRRKSGEVFVEYLSIVAVRDEQGQLQHYVGSFSDISQFKEHEADLNRIAHYDMLTSVPNRRLLGDRLQQAIARSHRYSKNLAVCYLDLDGFKPINDQFGHAYGDRLLVEISRRLQSISRGEDTVARLGGDEFVLLWNDIERESDCYHALNRTLAEVAAPVLLDGVPVTVSASIGVTIFPIDNVDADTLLQHADQAMYAAKQLGKNRYHLFDTHLE